MNNTKLTAFALMVAHGTSYRQAPNGSATGAESVAIGQESPASGKNSIALGYGSKATEDDTVSVGIGEATHIIAPSTRRIVNVTAGKHVNDAATVGQLNEQISALMARIEALEAKQ